MTIIIYLGNLHYISVYVCLFLLASYIVTISVSSHCFRSFYINADVRPDLILHLIDCLL